MTFIDLLLNISYIQKSLFYIYEEEGNCCEGCLTSDDLFQIYNKLNEIETYIIDNERKEKSNE